MQYDPVWYSMSNQVNGGIWKGVAVLVAIVIAAIAIVVIFLAPPPQLGSLGCIFYSADSKPSGYTVYATVSNNLTYPVVMEKVYFDGAEQAYSTIFPADISGIWSMKVGDQSTRTMGISSMATILLRVAGVDPIANHTVRVVANASSFEFNVTVKLSSLTLDTYDFLQAPGFEYLKANIGNMGTAPGHVVEVTMDGQIYQYLSNAAPPKINSSWSMLVEGRQSPIVGVGQQGVLYIDTSVICHSCTHMVKVSCSDGSYIEFSFRPW